MPDDTTPRDDAGFSLVEVVVAMAIFVVLTVAVLAVLVTSLGGVRSNAQRVQAANLAAQQIEAVRSQRADDIPDGTTTASASGTTVEGTTYTVQQSAAFYAGDQKQNVCDSSSDTPSFKRVSVSVTWPEMGSVKPVRSATVVAVGLGDAGLTKGIVAVTVLDSTPAPVKNVPVRLDSGATSTTDDQGCAVFTDVVPGSYRSTLDSTGYVGIDGQQRYTSPETIAVTASKISRQTVQYDRPGRLSVTWKTPAGFRVPDAPGLPVSLGYALAAPPGPRPADTCPTGPLPQHCVTGPPQGPRMLTPLFPANYQVWAGLCEDSRPDAPAAVDLVRGGSQTVEVPLGSIQFAFGSQQQSYAGAEVSATHVKDPRCESTVLRFGTVPTSGPLGLAMPQGTWKISLSPSGSRPEFTTTCKITVGKTECAQ